MNEDQISILSSFVLYWSIFAGLLWVSKKRKKVLLTNLLVHITYSSFLLYGLNYKSEGGTSLVWFVYLLFALWIHTFINLSQMIYRLIKKAKYEQFFKN